MHRCLEEMGLPKAGDRTASGGDDFERNPGVWKSKGEKGEMSYATYATTDAFTCATYATTTPFLPPFTTSPFFQLVISF
jgi:hypothetical protein